MIECYHAADAVLLPSVGEGLPLVVQEAMAAGLPAVISAQEIYARDLRDVCATSDRTVPALVAAAGRRVLGPERETLSWSAGGPTRNGHWSVDVMVQRYLTSGRGTRQQRAIVGRCILNSARRPRPRCHPIDRAVLRSAQPVGERFADT